ncbi:MAG: endonuclease/exonuclease/phosphatase family protein [Solirubrobacteraceae bacterium]
MKLRVLTWNLMHGRSQPPTGHDLLGRFAAALADWEWDVALLQEVPPWWPASLAAALDAEGQLVLTSRNGLLVLRRAIATRWPDLIKANGGGANAILARRDRIVAHRTLRLCRWPERRWVHAVRLACGIWVANVHASAGDESRARRDAGLTASSSLAWAGGEPLVLGGDFNLRGPQLDGLRQMGLRHVGVRDVDHIFVASGLVPAGAADVLERGTLSDHPPLAATLRRSPDHDVVM